MSRMARHFSGAALIAIALCVPATQAEAQTPAHVRVVTESARISRWLAFPTDVILTVDRGTTLPVLDLEENWKKEDWYWVLLPPDAHGTRKVGWIRASVVEPVLSAAAPRDEAYAPALAAADPSASAVPETRGEDKVTISVGRDVPGASAADATKSFTFEDVHFDRDRDALRFDDIDRLSAAATALKGDPTLVVTLEGHTCNLGTTPYNLALGLRRATAVKDYLVSQGVPAERLLTVSRGEQDAKYDNAREETRRLNRRVALVPKVQR